MATPDDDSRDVATLAVIDECRALTHRLRAASTQLHGDGAQSAGRRGVLLDLARFGDMTVPDLARRRPVSRQHIQILVNSLLDDGLARLVRNPAHKRSKLVRLTAAGRRCVEAIQARESGVLGRLDLGVPTARLREAAETLRRLRVALENENWIDQPEDPT